MRKATIDNADCSVDEARALILDGLGATSKPISDVLVETGEDEQKNFRKCASLSILSRAGIGPSDSDHIMLGNEYRGYDLADLARRALELAGVNTHGLTKMELVGRAFTSSDFPLLLADSANKSMLKGFEEAPETWPIWCQTGNLSDFKQSSRVGLSSFDA